MSSDLYRLAMREYMRKYKASLTPEKLDEMKTKNRERYQNNKERHKEYYINRIERLGGRDAYNKKMREYTINRMKKVESII